MMLYDVLKASKGLYVNDSFAMLWGKQLGGWKIAELTGTLPMTFRSNGTALIDYRVFGTASGAGEQTENLFDKDARDTENGYVNPGRLSHNGNVITVSVKDSDVSVSEYIEIDELTDYTICDHYSTKNYGGCFYDKDKIYISGFTYNNVNHGNITITTPTNAKYMRLSVASYIEEDQYKMMFVKGSTAPSTYIPYGYKLPLAITSGTESKDTDIYIGDSKLLSGDYVDYESGKIVRNGTPQDPPLPFPELETYKGTNTLDSTEALGEVTIKGRIKETE